MREKVGKFKALKNLISLYHGKRGILYLAARRSVTPNPLWIIAFDKFWVSSLSSDGRLLLDEFDLQSHNLEQCR
ncbi:hypothetical protein CAL7716_004420 [Calothrix sp. PCC 7716]|nr:hypothetical protein CAL7716_004420 [Calothrix sp. PCC 7716]